MRSCLGHVLSLVLSVALVASGTPVSALGQELPADEQGAGGYAGVGDEQLADGVGLAADEASPSAIDPDALESGDPSADEQAKAAEHDRESGEGDAAEVAETSASDEDAQTDDATGSADAEAKSDEDSDEASEEEGLEAQAAATPTVRYRAHVQRYGWQGWFSNGKVAGTSGESLRMEAFRIELRNAKNKLLKGISYQTHVQSIGWQDWVSDGALAGTEGRGLRAEAIRIRLSDELAASYDVWYCVHIQRHGWLGWAKNGEAAGSSGYSLRVEALRVQIVPKGQGAPSASTADRFVDGAAIRLDGHVQTIGWVNGTDSVGTVGQGLRMEAIKARLTGAQYAGSVVYSAHVQGIGWQGEVADGAVAGTSGQSKRVEAITMRLTGDALEHYDVYYRLHVQTFGWLGWASNGERAGTAGLSRRAESIQVRLVPKGSAAPSAADSAQSAPYISSVDVSVAAKLAGEGWQGTRMAGQTAGSTSKGKALEQLRFSVSVAEGALAGGTSYRIRPVGGDWTALARNGADVGLSGTGANGVKLSLTGGLKDAFDVCYRVYVSKYGWLAWVRNGKQAGTEVANTQIEALQVTVVPKGTSPGANGSWPVGYLTQATVLGEGQALSDANAAQRKLVRAARSTAAAPAGYCAQWVEDVYANAGYGRFYGDACDLYDRYCTSSDLTKLKCGMIVCVSTHPHTYAGSIWGHVGIFVGDGTVLDSVYGYVRTSTLKEWMDYYGATVPVKWGWLGNVNVA